MRASRWTFLVLFGGLLLLRTGPLRGAESNLSSSVPTKESLREEFGGKDDRSLREPIDIGSRQMSVDMDSHTIVFQGDVNVRQGELQLLAQEVTALFGTDIHDIFEITAKGNVSVQKGARFAYGEKAVYDRRRGTIELTGDPRLKEGDNFIRGEKIRVWLDKERMEVQGDVQAVFTPAKQPGSPGQDVRTGPPPQGRPSEVP